MRINGHKSSGEGEEEEQREVNSRKRGPLSETKRGDTRGAAQTPLIIGN